MKNLALGLLLAAAALPVAAQDKTLTVWDFKSAEPLMQPYFEKVKELFNAKHPDIALKQVAQPGNNYYVLLGTAINANEGPDVALVHNGADALTRADAFVRLKDEVADIQSNVVGWESFRSSDGTFVAVPISIQGVALYYNKEVYKEAGLDPEKAPQTRGADSQLRGSGQGQREVLRRRQQGLVSASSPRSRPFSTAPGARRPGRSS